MNENLVVGNYVDAKYVVKAIKGLDDIDNVALSEEIFTSIGKFRLILYRNLNGNLSLLIVMTKGISGMYQYRLELIHPTDAKKNIKFEDEEYFRIMWPNNSRDLMKYLDFYEEGYYNEKTDSLSVQLAIRSSLNEALKCFSMVERSKAHRIMIKNFKELLDQNIINYVSFYDEMGYCWKLLLKRNNFFERRGDEYFSGYIYLLNGMYNVE